MYFPGLIQKFIQCRHVKHINHLPMFGQRARQLWSAIRAEHLRTGLYLFGLTK